jgi:hypothetical protein
LGINRQRKIPALDSNGEHSDFLTMGRWERENFEKWKIKKFRCGLTATSLDSKRGSTPTKTAYFQHFAASILF